MAAVLESVKMTPQHTPKGEGTDRELLDVIARMPGLSKYELAKAAGWSMGKTDGAITRLLKNRQIYLMVLERVGRRVNLIYPTGYVRPDYISINVEDVPHNAVSAVVYALDSNTIGVSWGENKGWSSVSFQRKEIPLNKAEGNIRLIIPDEFRRFYGLDHRHYTVSTGPEGVLISVSGEIKRAA